MPSYNMDLSNKSKQDSKNERFTKEQLKNMSTYKLKNICREYKIVKGYNQKHSREELIDIILRYRGLKKPDLIKKYQAGGVKNLQRVIDNYLARKLEANGKIEIPAKITLYKELGINREDAYQVIAKNEIAESNVLLLDGKNNLCGIFNLEKIKSDSNKYYLVGNKEHFKLEKLRNKNYNLLFFSKKDSNYLYQSYYAKEELPPNKLDYYRLSIIDFKVKELESTDTTLCIDFGTSNTTAGAYLDKNYISNISNNDLLNQRIRLDEINYVKFPTKKSQDYQKTIPTIVYVQNCQDQDNIDFLFGHHAKIRMKKNDYSSNASVFQGIKKWVSSYEKQEEICDEAGNIAVIERKRIIKAYINYIIQRAEAQFKCKFRQIHISSPVKLKEQFIAMFQEIIDEYQIETEAALDEGISVLYNTIANLIKRDKYQNGCNYKALVIDCGGGTTDLSSCEFRINKGSIAYQVEITTGFENGDTNFGGNNITYRIMQFMKLVFANYYSKAAKTIDIDELIPFPEGDIFRKVDTIGIDRIYQKLEQDYQAVEKIIPTCYKEYENQAASQYQKVKNNFYFLWELAENMKKDFFKRTNILRNTFDASSIKGNQADLHITPLKDWRISIYNKQGLLETKERFPEIIFNIKEIKKLIKADIYKIVKKFLEDLYENRKLMEYSVIKLTGQSCKIDIFKEALKEFVPGRSIEFRQRDNDSLELKLACLKGVIKYMKAKKVGDIVVDIKNQPPIMPYYISAFTFTGEERIIIDRQHKLNQAKGHISKPLSTAEIEFLLKGEQGNLKQSYIYKNNFSQYQKVRFNQIKKEYQNKITQLETDKINNNEVKFFLFTIDGKWGFFVVPIARKDEQLFLGKEEYFAFESDLATLDFFDGQK